MSSSMEGEVRRDFGKMQGGGGGRTGDPKAEVEAGAKEASGTVEKLADKAKDAISDAADSASDLARDAYDRGERYAREMRDRFPDADRYWREGSQVIRQQVGDSPVLAFVLAGLVGVALGWLLFGGSSHPHHRR